MRIFYALDEGLACPCQTGFGLSDVRSLQTAVKVLVQSKEVMAVTVDEIEVYDLGVNRQNFHEHTPLQPDDPLPQFSNRNNPIFVHAPHEVQELEPGERYIQHPSERRLSMATIPREEEPPKPQRRASMPITMVSHKSELPDMFKQKYFVTYGKQQIQVLMDPQEPLINLKMELEEATGVATHEQAFYFNGVRNAWEDDKTLKYYGLQGGAFFTLVREEVPYVPNPRRASAVAQVTPQEFERQKQRRDSLLAAERARKEAEEAERLAEEARLAEEERLAEEARQAEEARKAKELADQLEAERLAREAEEAARKAEEERLAREAAEEAARIAEEERLAEEARKAEELRKAKELADKLEADRLAREAEARRLAEEEAARNAEEERLAAEAEAKRIADEEFAARVAEAQRKKEEERLAAEAEARRKAQEERLAKLAAEKKAKEEEEQRLRDEEEAKRKAEEEWMARVLEEQRKAKEEEEEAARLAREKELEEVDEPGPNEVYDGMGLARGPDRNYPGPGPNDAHDGIGLARGPGYIEQELKPKKEKKKKNQDDVERKFFFVVGRCFVSFIVFSCVLSKNNFVYQTLT